MAPRFRRLVGAVGRFGEGKRTLAADCRTQGPETAYPPCFHKGDGPDKQAQTGVLAAGGERAVRVGGLWAGCEGWGTGSGSCSGDACRTWRWAYTPRPLCARGRLL